MTPDTSTTAIPTPASVHDQLIATLPKMCVWALALARQRAEADDLIQDVAGKVLAAQDRFVPGTNFAAWVHRIMINHFITGARKKRKTVDLDEAFGIGVDAGHEDRLVLKELAAAVARLPAPSREALLMVVMQEMSYETAAEIAGCAPGTMKSRVHRTRIMLRAWMMNDGKETAAKRQPRRSTPKRTALPA